MSGGGGEKTEKPTTQKKREARKEGRVARTPDLGSWGGLLVASALLPMVIRNMMESAERMMIQVSEVIANPEPEKIIPLLRTAVGDGALAAAPLAGGMMLVGLAAAAAQGGLHVATKQFKPDFKRLNPWSGLKKSFGPHAFWEAVKATVKTAVLAGVLYASMRQLLPALATAGSLSLGATVGMVADAVLTLLRTVALAGLVMAVADYAVAHRRVGKQLRMTKHEVKEEHKRQEGDPQLKAAIRGRQMAMGRQRMMADLEKADVVLVNPTHVAVALRYEPSRGAPRVVAKGAGVVAKRIREIAAENRIPMVHDVALARALYKACDLGHEIPAELYTAVARVLAFVMTLKARGAAAGLHRSPALTASM
jgi:flagellar biosynthesis protein FlhB